MPETLAKRGRPKDARAAQAAILDAAEAAFAEHGFDGARIDAIADASGYNKSLIFHYFDDKLGLYTAVLRRADEQGRYLSEQFFELLPADTTITADQFRRFIEQIVSATFDYYVAHPRLLRILAWEEAEGWTTLMKIASRFDQSDVEKFTSILTRVQQAGVLRPCVTLPFILYVITNFCRTYITSMPMFQLLIPDVDWAVLDTPASARQQIVTFIVNGLIPDSPVDGAGPRTGG